MLVMDFFLPWVPNVSALRVFIMCSTEIVAMKNSITMIDAAYAVLSDIFLNTSFPGEAPRTPDRGRTPKHWATANIEPIAQWKLSGFWNQC